MKKNNVKWYSEVDYVMVIFVVTSVLMLAYVVTHIIVMEIVYKADIIHDATRQCNMRGFDQHTGFQTVLFSNKAHGVKCEMANAVSTNNANIKHIND